ncbi:MAG TPA: M23 family metallopeptidase [Coriobacteriia bacterium]|nr:M23 family metallopeptidase [Coriobacteriia bacterium]
MHCRKRRFSSTLTAAILFAALAFPSSAMAASQPTPAAAVLQQRLTSARTELAASSERLAEAEVRVARADAAISRVEALQPQDVGETVMYVLKVSLSPFNDSFRDDTADARDAAGRLDVLYAERDQARTMLADARVRLAQTEKTLDAAAAAVVEAERLAAEQAAAAEAARAAAAERYGRFPVDGPVDYVNSWGFARSVGRSHKGTDIMARRGTRVVAVHDGTVEVRRGGLGGLTIWLTADGGTKYYYAHLDTEVVRSGHVTTGQVIGTVGSTGNASASAPHLHFEVHSPSAVNPFPILERMVR